MSVNVPSPRDEILAIANKRRLALGTNPRPYTMRHIQRAVFVARQTGDVAPSVLAAAGFRP